MKIDMGSISLAESKRLIQLEKIIEAGKKLFVEVGLALAEIRDSRLYRCEYSTFEDYCKAKWGWTRQRAYQVMDAAGIVQTLPPTVSTIVDNEGKTRELAKAPKEKRVEVLQAAQEKAEAAERPMTAKDVKEATLEVCAPTPSRPHVANNSGENEWYTPIPYIEAAAESMGSIDLDPASCEAANQFVKAETFYDIEDNGLEQQWFGNVWMNPPYAQPLISQFAEKVTAEFLAGKIKQACVLVNNATDTTWFHRMMEAASAVCFIRGRIRFINKDGEPVGAPLQGQTVLYFGSSVSKFTKTFKQFGFVLS